MPATSPTRANVGGAREDADMTSTTQPELREQAASEHWTTERIREAFIDDGGQAEYYDPINGAREQRRVAGDIFDRWLAAHDAQVLRDFADRMANGIYLETGGSAHHEAFNRAHMDAATLARAEATRIEEEQG